MQQLLNLAADCGRLYCGDNLDVMRRLPDGCCHLIYADPPFCTGGVRRMPESEHDFDDRWSGGVAEFLAFLDPRLREMRRLLAPSGSLYLHLDWRTVHYAKCRLDEIFGAAHFLNEIVWTYRTGGTSQRWFARKHDSLLLYARDSQQHTFHVLRDGDFRTDGLKRDDRGRPYKNTRRGRLYFHGDGPAMTDVWDVPFLSTVSDERNGYPSQKPERLIERVVRASSNPGDVVADFFCGSGTTLAVAHALGRRWIGCDVSPGAIRLTAQRLGMAPPIDGEDGRTEATSGEDR